VVLQHHFGRSFDDLQTVEGSQYHTWHEVATALGLFSTQSEGYYAIKEGVECLQTPAQLRFLFARVILEGYPALPIWTDFRIFLIRDHVDRLQSESRGCDQALREINTFIHEGGRCLSDFGLPEPDDAPHEVLAELEPFVGRHAELREAAASAYSILTPEQRHIFRRIHAYITHTHEHPESEDSRPMFIEGKPGRGKSFLIQAVLSSLRSDGLIVLIVGTTALSVQQYERGRTAHHVFRIPVSEVRYH
jgi:hypothetical protein